MLTGYGEEGGEGEEGEEGEEGSCETIPSGSILLAINSSCSLFISENLRSDNRKYSVPDTPDPPNPPYLRGALHKLYLSYSRLLHILLIVSYKFLISQLPITNYQFLTPNS